MAIEISGTGGNDVIQPYGNSLVLTVSGSVAENIWPMFNVVVNGVTVLSNVSVTANHATGATQVVNVPMPAGTTVSSLSIQYTNDAQTTYANEDRNLFLSSVVLNGHALNYSDAVYERTGGTPVGGQGEMVWGGSLNWSGASLNFAPIASGDVNINAFGGIDTVIMPGVNSDYTLSHVGAGYTATHGGDVINLTNVERLQFSNTKVALDMDGHAGTAAHLIAALFGQGFLSQPVIVGVGISLLDGGMSETTLAGLAVNTATFQNMAGSSSNADFVKLVWQNVMHTPVPSDALAYYTGLLDSGQFTQASLAVLAAHVPQNEANLVGVHDSILYA